MKRDDTFDKFIYQALGEKILAFRKESGRTYDEVAYLLDLSPNTYYRYEIGDRKMPITVFKKLCVLYKVDMTTTLKEVYDDALQIMTGNK
jgi:transcriptional regulator with XRE-family HTH domain